ncbi:hypothetical protein X777_11561 [Ooceraea biroi]|uniref:Uncharacterized protein n=1 Tax=Ooceraea biroi TaxID=2015173 RepID=A0A026W296_OOCBI|nr:hypothetical protein X777_11561 [Ooceraea biroi]
MPATGGGRVGEKRVEEDEGGGIARGIEKDRGAAILFVPRAREPIVTGENSAGGGGVFSFSEGAPPPGAALRKRGRERGNEGCRGWRVNSRSGLRDARG